MRKPVLKIAVHPGTYKGKDQRNGNNAVPVADQGEQGAGTGAREGPAQPENNAAVDGSPVIWPLFNIDLFTVKGLYIIFPDQENGNSAHHNRQADDAVHMDRFETEHLLDPEPGDHFRFGEDDPEQDPKYQVFDVFHGR